MESAAEPKAPSPELRAFISESLDRPWIFAFVARAAGSLRPGTRVLDAGSGNAPYRELFRDCRYFTADRESTPHAGNTQVDVLASLENLPLADASFDLVLCTQVLEHVPEPLTVLREFHRLLIPGGQLWLTAPLVWELHEEPFDFFRYTSHGLRSLLSSAEFEDISIEPLTGYFTTLSQLIRNAGPITGMDDAGGPFGGRFIAAVLFRVAPILARLDRFDRRRGLPLGYGCRATRASIR